MASVIDEFNNLTITRRVKKLIEAYQGKEMKVSDYNKILFQVLKYYIDDITLEFVELMTYKFFLDLLLISENEAAKFINTDSLNLIRLDLPLKILINVTIIESGKEKLANDSYLLLSSTAEKFLCYNFMILSLPDFQPKVDFKRNEILNYLQKYK